MDITNTQNQLLKVIGELAVEQEKTHALLEALKAVEWAGHDTSVNELYPTPDPTCPTCSGCNPEGHTADCQLAAALRLGRGEQ